MTNLSLPSHCRTRTRHRVIIAETDMMGIVYHANYIQYLERGRLHYMRNRDLPYKEVVARGLHFAIIDVNVSYKKPAYFDDFLLIETQLTGDSRVTVEFEYSIYRCNEDSEQEPCLLTIGYTRQACIDKQGRPRAIPTDILQHLVSPESSPASY